MKSSFHAPPPEIWQLPKHRNSFLKDAISRYSGLEKGKSCMDLKVRAGQCLNIGWHSNPSLKTSFRGHILKHGRWLVVFGGLRKEKGFLESMRIYSWRKVELVMLVL